MHTLILRRLSASLGVKTQMNIESDQTLLQFIIQF